MCNLKNLVAACALLLATCLPTSAFAFEETLTFRLNAQGEVEVVIQGYSRGAGCDPYPDGVRFSPPQNIVIGSNTILIQSDVPGGCSIPRVPAPPYEVFANLGHLSGATYQVTWNVGLVSTAPPVRSLIAILNVADLYPVGAPALSGWWLCILVLSMAGVTLFALRKRAAR